MSATDTFYKEVAEKREKEIAKETKILDSLIGKTVSKIEHSSDVLGTVIKKIEFIDGSSISLSGESSQCFLDKYEMGG